MMRALVLLLLAASAKPSVKVESLSWLAGSWVSTEAGQRSEEHWAAPLGGTMVGMNRAAKGNETLFFEFLLIEERAGTLVYIARPRGGAPVEFTRIDGGDHWVLFANPEHDYPKRIRYERHADGSLVARTDDGKDKADEFRWRPGKLGLSRP